MARIRTIPKAAEEIKTKDPGTCVTYSVLRRWVHEGRIKTFDGGKCKMVDLATGGRPSTKLVVNPKSKSSRSSKRVS